MPTPGLPAPLAAVVESIPSPPRGTLYVGPIPLRAYALCIVAGVVAAVLVARARWVARGGAERTIADLAVWAVPAGLIGARIYHVVTDWQLYSDDPLGALRIWDGGLGIWGGVAVGTAVGLWMAHRWGLDLPVLLDTVAPAIPLAQAIGRWGNWFNQELFGRPTSLPWGLRIDLDNRPPGYLRDTTFHPTFLYESLWCLVVVGIVLAVERRNRLRPGRLFAVYVAAYTFGRFWFELLRIDPANHIAGLRVNDWISLILFVGAMAVIVTGRRRPDDAAAEIESVLAGPRQAPTTTPTPPSSAVRLLPSGEGPSGDHRRHVEERVSEHRRRQALEADGDPEDDSGGGDG